ncbi:MAG: hypothetical protein KIG62_02655 [Oscillospiraceae bacterium]|nr:hypothetical protein [Oscillospiraceae bacterium]
MGEDVPFADEGTDGTNNPYTGVEGPVGMAAAALGAVAVMGVTAKKRKK